MRHASDEAGLIAGAGALGAGLGGLMATKAAAADQGAEKIHVLRWGCDADPQRVLRTFDRATTSSSTRPSRRTRARAGRTRTCSPS